MMLHLQSPQQQQQQQEVCVDFIFWVSTTREMLLSFLSLHHNKRQNFLAQQASYCMM
jgi:hypothetical protein